MKYFRVLRGIKYCGNNFKRLFFVKQILKFYFYLIPKVSAKTIPHKIHIKYI